MDLRRPWVTMAAARYKPRLQDLSAPLGRKFQKVFNWSRKPPFINPFPLATTMVATQSLGKASRKPTDLRRHKELSTTPELSAATPQFLEEEVALAFQDIPSF